MTNRPARGLAAWPPACHQESGDGNRIAALVIETLASVLEGGFDEGGCIYVYVALKDVRTWNAASSMTPCARSLQRLYVVVL